MDNQTETEPQAEPPSQPQSQSQTQTQNFEDCTTIPLSETTTAPNDAVVNASQLAPSPPSKIPSRPRKIRKLTPVNNCNYENSDPNDYQIMPLSDNPTPVSTSRATKSKIVQKRAPFVPRIAARPLSCEGEVETALRHLRNADALLAPLIDVHQRPIFDSFQTPFLALTRSILYQQLAYKAGTSIYTRFIALCGGETGVLPETVLSLNPQQLRQIGVSGRKASYLQDLARKYQNGILSDAAIVNMDDKSLFTMLTMVNGIGSWSVHMFMIFSLHRPDVLPINDLNIRKGVQLLYSLEELPRPSQMDQLCEKWRPYRSVGSWYMWRLAEEKGASASAASVVAGATSLQQQQQQQQQQHEERQEHQQPQLLDPINSILNLGACAWGQ